MPDLTAKICPVHGPVQGEHCRAVVERTNTHIRYCHMEQDVPVVPKAQLEAITRRLDRLLGAVETYYAESNALGGWHATKLIKKAADEIKAELEEEGTDA